MSEIKEAFEKEGYKVSEFGTILPSSPDIDPLVYNFLGAWDLVNDVLTCYEPSTGNVVQEILPTYIIKQVHTFVMYYAVKGRSPNDAKFNLQTKHHDIIGEEFLFMNDQSDWEVTLEV